MDKLGEALIKLVEQGTTAAVQIAGWYFIYNFTLKVALASIIVWAIYAMVVKIVNAVTRYNDQKHQRSSR